MNQPVFSNRTIFCLCALFFFCGHLRAADSQLPAWTGAATKVFKSGAVTLYLHVEKQTLGTDGMSHVRACAARDGGPFPAEIRFSLDGKALPVEKLADQYLCFLYDDTAGRKTLQIEVTADNRPLITGSIPITITQGKPCFAKDFFPIGTWHFTSWGKIKDVSMEEHLTKVFDQLHQWGINTVCTGWSGNDDRAIFEAGARYGIKSIFSIRSVDDLVCTFYHSPMRFEPGEKDIRIEGENFGETSGFVRMGEVTDVRQPGLPKMWRWGYAAVKDLSGREVAHLWRETDPGKEGYFVRYSFVVSEAGTYKLLVLMSAVSRWHVSPFSWQLDDGPVHSMDRGMAHGSSFTHDGCKTILDMSWHQLGFRYLPEGTHSLKIIVAEKGIEGAYTQSIDQIVLHRVWEGNPVGSLTLRVAGADQRPAWGVVADIDSAGRAVTDCNGLVRIDGVPAGEHTVRVFPVDTYDIWGAPPSRREMIARYSGKGYIPKEIKVTIRDGQETGAGVILDRDYFSLSKAEEIAGEYARRFSGNPLFLGYYMTDEPESAWLDSVLIFKKVFGYYDPVHPTFSCCLHAHAARLFIDKTNPEVLLFDLYRHFKAAPVGDFGGFGAEVDRWREMAGHRPLWIVLPAYQEGEGTRWPTPAEARAMIYMSVGRGVKGIFYFYLHPCMAGTDDARRYIDAVVPVNEKLGELSPVLLACNYTDNIARCSSGEVHTLAGKDNGPYYLVVINKDMFVEKDITVTVPDAGRLRVTGAVGLPSGDAVMTRVENGTLAFTVRLIPGDGAIFKLEQDTETKLR